MGFRGHTQSYDLNPASETEYLLLCFFTCVRLSLVTCKMEIIMPTIGNGETVGMKPTATFLVPKRGSTKIEGSDNEQFQAADPDGAGGSFKFFEGGV